MNHKDHERARKTRKGFVRFVSFRSLRVSKAAIDAPLSSLPDRAFQLVAGKFLAVMALVAIALALTLFLPITVEALGNLDWGPVFGGYLAALLLAAAYVAIGLFISSRTDNQIVALILTVLLCGLFYLAGSRGVTDFFRGSRGRDPARRRLGQPLRASSAAWWTCAICSTISR